MCGPQVNVFFPKIKTSSKLDDFETYIKHLFHVVWMNIFNKATIHKLHTTTEGEIAKNDGK